MAKVLKTLTVSWNWNGDKYSLRGFNIAITENDKTPTESVVSLISYTTSDIKELYTYEINNLTLDTSKIYKVWVQAVYEGKDSDWVSKGEGRVTDDGSATIVTKDVVYTKQETDQKINIETGKITTEVEEKLTLETLQTGPNLYIEAPLVSGYEYVTDTMPDGSKGQVLQVHRLANQNFGNGQFSEYIDVDPNRSYLVTMWIKVYDSNGRYYLGHEEFTSSNADNDQGNGPYGHNEHCLQENIGKWRRLSYIIQPYNATSTENSHTAPQTNLTTGTDYKFYNANTKKIKVKIYLGYQTPNETKHQVTGLSVYELGALSNQTVTKTQLAVESDKITASFSKKGNNLIRNGCAYNGLNFMLGNRLEIHNRSSTTIPASMAFKISSTNTNEETARTYRFSVKSHTSYIVSAWVTKDSNVRSTEIHYLGSNDVKTESNETSTNWQSQVHLDNLTYTAWTQVSFEVNTGENKSAYIRFDNNGLSSGSSGYVYFTCVQMYEGKLIRDSSGNIVHQPWQPNSNEIYGSQIKFDDNGMEVVSTQRKAKTNIGVGDISITRTDTNERIFEVLPTGELKLKGQMTITNGNVGGSTVVDGGCLTANSISGEKIKANTILSESLIVGDLENLWIISEKSEGRRNTGFGDIIVDNGYIVKSNTTSPYLMVTSHVKSDVRSGDQFYIEFKGKCTENANSIDMQIWFYDSSKSYITSANFGRFDFTTTEKKYVSNATIPENNQIREAIYYVIGFSCTGKKLMLKEGLVKRKNKGELIVDGAITANKISAKAVTADKLQIGSSSTCSLYVKGTGLNRSSDREVKINGHSYISSPRGRGLELTVINKTTYTKVSSTLYDVYIEEVHRNNLATALNNLTDDVIVVLTSYDAIRFNNNLEVAIEKCGGKIKGRQNTGTENSRTPYALIGIPGIGEGNGIEIFTSSEATAPFAETTVLVVDGVPTGIGSSFSKATVIDGAQVTTGIVKSGNDKSIINLDNGSVRFGKTTDTSYINYDGSNLTIKANSLSISGSDVVTNNNITTALDQNIITGFRNYVLSSNAYATNSGENTNYFLNLSNDVLKDIRGKKITVSAEFDTTNIRGSRVGFEPGFRFADQTTMYTGVWINIPNATTFKGRKSVTFTIPDKEVIDIVQCGMFFQGITQGTAKIGKPQLEISTIKSEWKPAPEDSLVGGRNYYKINTELQTMNSATVARNNENIITINVISLGSKTQLRVKNVITENGWWTVSFYVKASVNCTLSFDICDMPEENVKITNVWKYVTFTRDVNNYSSTYNFFDVSDNAEGAKTIYIKNLMIEKGQIAHPHVNAPEDKVNNNQNDIYNGLTQGATQKGIYLSGNNLLVNASYIKTGYLDAERLSVVARNMVNNPATSGSLDHWTKTSLMTIHTIGTTKYNGVKAFKLETNSNALITSDWFEVDPNKTYKVTMSVRGIHANSKYFGLYGQNTERNGIGFGYVYPSGSDLNNTANDTNFYFWSKVKDSTNNISGNVEGWVDIEGYILPHWIESEAVVPLQRGKNCDRYAIMKPNTKYIQLRFLNYNGEHYGDGQVRDNYYTNISVSEVGSGAINANSIVTGTINADRLDANTIVSKVNGASTTISGDKITTGTIIGEKIKVNSIDADRLKANSITADKMLLGSKDNLVCNWNFENDALDSKPKGWSGGFIAPVTSLPNSTKTLRFNGTGQAQHITEVLNRIYVAPGETFYIEYDVQVNPGTNGIAGLGLLVYKKNNSEYEYPLGGVNSSSLPAGTWQRITKKVTVGADACYAVPWVNVQASSTTGAWFITNLKIYRQITGRMIVDGSITSNTIDTDELFSNSAVIGSIKANVLTVENINGLVTFSSLNLNDPTFKNIFKTENVDNLEHTVINGKYILTNSIRANSINLRGLEIENSNGIRTLSIDSGGNIAMKGTISSDNFSSSSNTGWQINYDGTATLNNAIVRGLIDMPYAGMDSKGLSDSSIRIWAGSDYSNKETAPFRVTQDGRVIAEKGEFKGTLTGELKIHNITIKDDPNKENDALIEIKNNAGNKAIALISEEKAFFNTRFVLGDINEEKFVIDNNADVFKLSNTALLFTQKNKNLLRNSTFEKQTSDRKAVGWIFVSNTQIDSTNFNGYPVGIINARGITSNSYVGAYYDVKDRVFNSNQKMTASVWIYIGESHGIDSDIGLELKCYDTNGTQLDAFAYVTSTYTLNQWVRIHTSGNPPQNTKKIRIYLWVRKNGTIRFSCPQVEEGELTHYGLHPDEVQKIKVQNNGLKEIVTFNDKISVDYDREKDSMSFMNKGNKVNDFDFGFFKNGKDTKVKVDGNIIVKGINIGEKVIIKKSESESEPGFDVFIN